MNSTLGQLLTAADAPPVEIGRPDAPSPFLLIGDHAGNVVPGALGTLGVGEADRQRHIAWDIGVAGMGTAMADILDATFIRQAYSRLVIDCNRDPAAADAMPEVSDATPIPGNRQLSAADRAARVAAIHTPYQLAIASALARRDAAGQRSILIALHSFTPVMSGSERPWHVGVLHSGGTTDFALRVLTELRRCADLTIGDNEPYAMDAIDYTIPRHAFAARRPYAELEIRQDLIVTPEQQADWAARMAGVLRAAEQSARG